MKILITTTRKPDTLAYYYTKHLANIQGLDIYPAYTFDIEDEYSNKNMYSKFEAVYLPGLLTKKTEKYIDASIETIQPDVFIVIKGLYISPQYLLKLKKKNIILVNYNPDHPIYFEADSNRNSNLKKSVPLYHLVITYSPVIQKQLLAQWPEMKTAVIPFGYEESIFNTNDLSTGAMVRKICFAGTADQDRVKFISRLAKHKVKIDLYGNKFNKTFSHPGEYISVNPAVQGMDYLKTLQHYSISLNLYREQNIGSHNMRSFEIPSVGGIQLVEYSDQMNHFFKNNEEIFMYKSETELFSLIDHILKLPDEELNAVKQRIRKKTLASNCSYYDRAVQMINELNSII